MITLALTGDVMLGRWVAETLDHHQRPEEPWGEVVLAARPERRWSLGRGGRVVVRVSGSLGGAYRGWLIVRLISSSLR